MKNLKIKNRKYLRRIAFYGLLLLSILNSSFGQTSNGSQIQDLEFGQTLKREMTGAETHLYKFELKKNEFFQARVEQKGIDVMLKLLDAKGNILVTMDSPNEKQGPETISFIAFQSGNYSLQISGFDAKSEKGIYSIYCGNRRAATFEDKRRVEVERLFIEAINARDTGQSESAIIKFENVRLGWKELKDDYLEKLTEREAKLVRANLLYTEGQQSALKRTSESLQNALAKFETALGLYKEVNLTQGEANCLGLIGYVYNLLGDKQKGLDYCNQALPLIKTTGNKADEAGVLKCIGESYFTFNEAQKALEYFDQALYLFKISEDKIGEAMTLNNIGVVRGSLGEYAKAVEHYNQALVLIKPIGDKRDIFTVLSNLGEIYGTLGEYVKALDYLDQGLSSAKEIGDKNNEAIILYKIGFIHYTSGEPQKALGVLNEAAAIFANLGDKASEASALSLIGIVYSASGNKQEALRRLNQALPIQQIVGDKHGEAKTLQHIGGIYNDLGNVKKAMDTSDQALSILKSLDKGTGDVLTLINIGSLYSALGNRKKSLDAFQQALQVLKKTGAKGLEADVLAGMGSVYMYSPHKTDYETARGYFEQSLHLSETVGKKPVQALASYYLGLIYLNLEQEAKSRLYFSQALSLARDIGDKQLESRTMTYVNLFEVNDEDEDSDLASFHQTLLLNKSVGDKQQEAATLFGMMLYCRYDEEETMAVFFGKQSIKKIQQLRQSAQGLDNGFQKTLLSNYKRVYQFLAGLLIRQGRFHEAINVINLYLDEQVYDFDRSSGKPAKQLLLSPRENRLDLLYNRASDNFEKISRQIEELKRLADSRQLNEQESSNLESLEAERKTATNSFQAVLENAEEEFSNPADNQDKAGAAAEVIELQAALRKLSKETKQKTVALYTVTGADDFRILLVTPDDIKASYSYIDAYRLNRKVMQFYALLQSPTYDPRPISKELYEIIFKPIEAKLKESGAQTLMWQLDGVLRYVPMAALFDGEKYLVERYQTVAFTRTDKKRMTRNVSRNWTGTGFGNSRAATVYLNDNKISFSDLPGVSRELESIFRTDKGAGILDGKVLFDTQFTKGAFYEAMKKRRPLVHISSHFSFRPSDDSDSFLLLGDGFLTLNEMKEHKKLFQGVELLTLSACDTAATRPDASGKEIDGFAELAQRLGAGAVIATLWQVSDSSTPWLMRDFYANRQNQNQMTKAEALQKAQIALLNGTAKVEPLQVDKKNISPKVEIIIVRKGAKPDTGINNQTRSDVIYLDESDAPLYQSEGKPAYAHPYYWSPFILFGNWR